MKLQIKGTTECFHVEHGVGKALLAIAPDKIALYVEPAPDINSEVQWSIIGAADRQLYLTARCDVCHQGATLATVTPWKHCGTKLAEPPDELADRLREHLAKRKEANQPTEPQKGAMHWV